MSGTEEVRGTETLISVLISSALCCTLAAGLSANIRHIGPQTPFIAIKMLWIDRSRPNTSDRLFDSNTLTDVSPGAVVGNK